jgi:guanylate kinase
MKRGRLINIAGPSAAAGKSAVMAALMARPKFNAVRLSTYTTREPRPKDPYDRAHHHFVTTQKFLALKKERFFFETKKLKHAWYGTPIRDIERLLNSGKNVLTDADAQRIKKFRQGFPDMMAIFVDAPTAYLRKRMIARGDSPEEIVHRLRLVQRERKFKRYFDLTVENRAGHFDEIVQTIRRLRYIGTTHGRFKLPTEVPHVDNT